MCSVDQWDGSLDQITERYEGWERIPLKIDSGAVDTVIPKNVAASVPLVETERSRAGTGFRAANGTHIKHYGQRNIDGFGDQYQGINMKAQVAEVRSSLGSVSQMVRAGNRVHFEAGNCYVQHIASGKITPIEEKDGMYEIGIWVQSAVPCRHEEPDFARQGGI